MSKTQASPEQLKAFQKGFDAYRFGVVVGDNPHAEYHPCHWHWMTGWSEAGIQRLAAKQGWPYDKQPKT